MEGYRSARNLQDIGRLFHRFAFREQLQNLALPDGKRLGFRFRLGAGNEDFDRLLDESLADVDTTVSDSFDGFAQFAGSVFFEDDIPAVGESPIT